MRARESVYELKKDYSGVMWNWKREAPILLAMKKKRPPDTEPEDEVKQEIA